VIFKIAMHLSTARRTNGDTTEDKLRSRASREGETVDANRFARGVDGIDENFAKRRRRRRERLRASIDPNGFARGQTSTRTASREM
jgi:hypothetical protein